MSSHSSKRDEKGRNIQVVVRCRPFNTQERKSSHSVVDCDSSRKEVTIKTGGQNDKAARKTYTFDMVFGPTAKQIEVYRSVVCPILDEVIMGYNCTVFAYGQTGTGKTFTMEGERTQNEQFTWEEDPLAGIIPRTLHQIFEKLTENGTEFSVKVSLLEIYNEELFDLLSSSEDVSERLQLFDDPRNKRTVVVRGLEEVTVHNKDEIYQILERGSAKRRTEATLMNSYSSRSHSVFSITIHMKEITIDGEELVKIGKLNLVDLAGSENIGRSGAVDKRAREAGNINQSLLTLGRVITALVEKRPHIPYRESKLTRILQDSLGGRTKTSIIATVSPASINVEESLSTLEYANRAKNIMNKPEVNQKLTKRTLIKEYTEEIERLKRDLAATREKNGVYLSAENYESMMSQITSQGEAAVECSETISALEEELKKIKELFTDSKSRLEQCSVDLAEKEQRLEETGRDLQNTRDRLSEEEFICSSLSTAQDQLYDTAGQLLSTVAVTTRHVSGLHDKLDRKNKVEQHNQLIQKSFAERMDDSFVLMQRSVQEQQSKQREVLSSCSQAIDAAVARSEDALQAVLSGEEALVGDVGRLMGESLTRFQERLQEQRQHCLQDKESFERLLAEHREDVEQVLVSKALVGLSCIQKMKEELSNTVETQRALASKVEAMKETGDSFSGLLQQLAELRLATSQVVSSVMAQHKKQGEALTQAQERHRAAMSRSIQQLQEQLNMVSMEAQRDYSDLHSSHMALQSPLTTLQDNIHGLSAIEQQGSIQVERLRSTSSSLASSQGAAADQSQQTLEEMSSCCSHLRDSMTGLLERDLQWSSRARERRDTQTQEQLKLMGKVSAEAETLHETVDTRCSDRLLSATKEVSSRKEAARGARQATQNQIGLDRTDLDQQLVQMGANIETSRQLVQGFLQEELQEDVPTGATPQRHEFVYPRELNKSRSRSELLEGLRRQQEELQAALVEEEEEPEQEEDEHSLVTQDSQEDKLSSCNDSQVSEPPPIDENLVFDEAHHIPFFKQRKEGKKTAKNTHRSKAEGEAGTPQKSRLPLRCQN